MRNLTLAGCTLLAIAAAALPASAGCVTVGAAGDGLSKDIAVVMSTHGLANILEDRGLKGKGEVKTSCKAGAIVTECHSSQVACK